MSSRSPLVGTVILNYRSTEDTLACLSAVLTSSELDQRIIVADNTENTDEQARLRAALPANVEYLPLGGNFGYAAGNNAAMRRLLELGARFLWVINPDARITSTTLARLLATMRGRPDVGILGPRLTDGDPDAPVIMSDGGRIDVERYGHTHHDHYGARARDTPASVAEVDYVSGACMLIDARVVATVGLIPEDYFLYFEETDFCRRATAYGWAPSVDRSIVVEHFRRSAGWLPSAHYVYYMIRNRGLFAGRLGLSGADVVERAYTDLHTTFIDPWRGRVETREPSWLTTFDRLVAQAKADGRAGVTGPVDLDRIARGEWVPA